MFEYSLVITVLCSYRKHIFQRTFFSFPRRDVFLMKLQMCGAMIDLLANKKPKCKKSIDKDSIIIIIEVNNQEIFVLINQHYSSTERKQKTLLLNTISYRLIFFKFSQKSYFAGNFNYFFNSNLETSRGNPVIHH